MVCWACQGSRRVCNGCGLSADECDCGDDSEHTPCEDCGGTGVERPAAAKGVPDEGVRLAARSAELQSQLDAALASVAARAEELRLAREDLRECREVIRLLREERDELLTRLQGHTTDERPPTAATRLPRRP